ncbi:MAG: hypothetical protein EA401_08050 [Planctomycetota bacterium]|nr:MAG: hypothetical protein EA401_08050 [Planctomycetota bacterium]
MPFRSNEAAEVGRLQAHQYLINRLPHHLRAASAERLDQIIKEYGPVVESYPDWHPFICHDLDDRGSPRQLGLGTRIRGLDHNIFLRNAVITCPYRGHHKEVIETVQAMSELEDEAFIEAEELEVTFYGEGTVAILITCHWRKESRSGFIPKPIAVARMIESQLPLRRHAWVVRGETWQTMQHYLLGQPHGSRSSLFVDEATGQAMKTVWTALVEKGEVFGPMIKD